MLSTIIFSPLVFALILLFFKNQDKIRWISLILSLFHIAFTGSLLYYFDKSSASLQLVEQYLWVPQLGITYFIGIDGISIWLVILTSLLLPFCILVSWKSVTEKVKGFYISLMLLQTAMLGSFLAFDMILFYVFFELSLVPMYFLIGLWGGPRRIYSALKLFIYTMLGSVFMLVAIIYLMYAHYIQVGHMSTSVLDFYQLQLPFMNGKILSPQVLLFFAFCFAFAIKVPVFPFHTWLPDAHVEAPTAGSVILAAVMLKMGTYGFLRFAIPLFPDAVSEWSWLFLVLGVIGIIYGALVAMVQPDIKKLIAYSSVSHMGYVLVGLFVLNSYGLMGSIFQMLSHGISTGALFILVGIIYERTHSREIKLYGGLASVLPKYSIFFLIITLSSIAVPMTNGFVGEFLILLGSAQKSVWWAVFSLSGVVLGATYMLWMYKKVFFGQSSELVLRIKSDMNLREFFILTPVVIIIFWMGLFPQSLFQYSEKSIDHLLSNRDNYQLSIYGEEQ